VATEPEVHRPSEIRLRDPLSEVTRVERRNLLGVSAIGIVIARSGLVPSKITALGIEFGPSDQRAMLKMFAAIILYFLFAFVIYAISDLVAWRASFHQAVFEWQKRRDLMKEERTVERRPIRVSDRVMIRFLSRREIWSRATRPASLLRAIFDFAVPVLIAAYAVYALLTAAPPKTANPPKSAAIMSFVGPCSSLKASSTAEFGAVTSQGVRGGEIVTVVQSPLAQPCPARR
jgi:hypothetical protein